MKTELVSSSTSAAQEAPEAIPPTPRRLPRRWLYLGAGLIITVLLAALMMRGKAVSVVSATRRTLLQKVVTTGRVADPARIRLGSLAMGRVIKVAADEGDLVRQGDVLVELDSDQVQAEVDAAEAAVEAAFARLESIRTIGSRIDSEMHRQALIAVDSAQSQLDRTTQLANSGATTQKDLDEARRALDLAQSRLASAMAQAVGTGKGGSEIRSATAALSQARATLAGARAKLAQMRILAPVDAVVVTRSIEPGDVVQPGSALLELSQAGAPHIVAQPDEKNLSLLQLGQTGRASADSYPDRSFPVRLEYIAPAIDPQRGTVEIKLAVPEPPDYLKPDMTVSVDLTVANTQGVLVVPSGAIREADGQLFVLVVRQGRVARQPVTLGLRGEGAVEVREGLNEGDQVITDTDPVKPGDKVRARGEG